MCAGELVARVTFSFNHAGSLSQWVKYELGKHTAASGSSLHIWSRNHLAKHAWLIWKKSFISELAWSLSNLGNIYFVRFEKECCFFSSKDPPSKENPYEDIELERSCLGNKCVSPSSSSPVPGTPTKVAALTLSTLKTNKVLHQHHPLNRLFCSISSPQSLASSGRLQNGEASSSWNCARPRTLASPPLPASAPPLHPAALTTPPASLETHTIADGGKSPR